jgi:hypothetical protein
MRGIKFKPIKSIIMKISKYLTGILTVAALMFAGSACNKDGEMLIVKNGVFDEEALSVSASSLVLSATNDEDTVVRFQWPAVDFGKETAVSYTLELTTPEDTVGVDSWQAAKSFTVDRNVLTYGFTGKVLNNLLSTMGLIPGTQGLIVARIKADVNQYNGAASSVKSAFSNVVLLQITPYGLNLYVPGDYQGWNPGAAPFIGPVPGKAGLYEGYVNIKGTGVQYFKFTNAPDFDHTNYGDGGNNTFSTDGNAAGLSVPDGGYYELTADLNNNTWSAVKTTWSILGDATPGGWVTDTQLQYDEVQQVWKATAYLSSNGSFKFRANNNWVIDFGVNADGALAYADNPFFGYDANVLNISVSQSANYDIVLDLHVPGKYTYSLTKK